MTVGISATADDYGYMQFTGSDGTTQTISTTGLKITFANGYAKATSDGGSLSIALDGLASMQFSTEGTDPEYSIYDVNRDGNVNVADVNYVLDLVLNEEYESQADVNNDGAVNVADVNAILNYILANAS